MRRRHKLQARSPPRRPAPMPRLRRRAILRASLVTPFAARSPFMECGSCRRFRAVSGKKKETVRRRIEATAVKSPFHAKSPAITLRLRAELDRPRRASISAAVLDCTGAGCGLLFVYAVICPRFARLNLSSNVVPKFTPTTASSSVASRCSAASDDYEQCPKVSTTP